MQVFHTCGVPPSLGKIILPIVGWTRNSMNALTNSVTAKNGRAKGLPPGQAGYGLGGLSGGVRARFPHAREQQAKGKAANVRSWVGGRLICRSGHVPQPHVHGSVSSNAPCSRF